MPKIIITEPEKNPQPYRFDLDGKVAKIGRGSDNDIVMSCRSVSSNHCSMERVKGGYILRDHDSTNGIKQNGSLMEIIDLVDGMTVFVGDVSLEFKLSEDEIENLAEEEFTSHQKKLLPPIKTVELNAADAAASEKRAKNKKPSQNRKDPERKQSAQPGSPIAPSHSNQSPPPSPYAHRNPYVHKQSGSPFKTLLVFILVFAAFFMGLTIRHKMRTGEYLPTKVMNWLNQTPAPEIEKTEGAAEGEQSADGEAASEASDQSNNNKTPQAPVAPQAAEDAEEKEMMR